MFNIAKVCRFPFPLYYKSVLCKMERKSNLAFRPMSGLFQFARDVDFRFRPCLKTFDNDLTFVDLINTISCKILATMAFSALTSFLAAFIAGALRPSAITEIIMTVYPKPNMIHKITPPLIECDKGT